MQQNFEINERVLYQNESTRMFWKEGIIRTIFTNSKPMQFVLSTDNQEKVCVREDQIKSIPFTTNEFQLKKNLKTTTICMPLEESKKIDQEFQRILSQLVMQKNEDLLICEINSLLNKIRSNSILNLNNGPKILYTTYQFLLIRKASIIRNYPFAPTNKVLKKLRKLIFKAKNEILSKHNLQDQQIVEKQPVDFLEKIKKLRKLSNISYSDDSEKEEQPTAFYEHTKYFSDFRPYKPSITPSSSITERFKPNSKYIHEQLKSNIFKPVIVLQPQISILV